MKHTQGKLMQHVHSLKDLPSRNGEGVVVAAVTRCLDLGMPWFRGWERRCHSFAPKPSLERQAFVAWLS